MPVWLPGRMTHEYHNHISLPGCLVMKQGFQPKRSKASILHRNKDTAGWKVELSGTGIPVRSAPGGALSHSGEAGRPWGNLGGKGLDTQTRPQKGQRELKALESTILTPPLL